MDISTNLIDLMYLTNASTMKKIKQVDKKIAYTQEELIKYRKRIFQQTKELLLGKSGEVNIQNVFTEYVRVSIEHFKFCDKRTVIQKDYDDIVITKRKPKRNIDYGKINKLVIKSTKPSKYRITDCLNIKVKNNKSKLVIPRERNYNIEEKDNITIKYDEKKIQKKKEDKQNKEKNKKK